MGYFVGEPLSFQIKNCDVRRLNLPCVCSLFFSSVLSRGFHPIFSLKIVLFLYNYFKISCKILKYFYNT